MTKKNLETAFREFVKAQNLFNPGDRVVVACSGGLDSTLLFDLLHSSADDLGIKNSLLHVNHSLRGDEAERDAQFVRSLAADKNIDFILRTIDVKTEADKNKMSLQEAGHELRDVIYRELLTDGGFDKIATAHHKDDQLETMLMRFISGSGIRGMAGLRPAAGSVVRPLLFASRDEIESCARSRRLQWIEDSSNKKTDYLRNKLRLDLVPILKAINPSVADSAYRQAEIFARITEYLEELALEHFDNALLVQSRSEIVLAIPELTTYFNMLGFFMIEKALKCLNEAAPGIAFRQFEQIEELLEKGKTGAQITIADGYRILRDRERLVIYRAGDEPQPVEVKIGANVDFGGISVSANVKKWEKDSIFTGGRLNEVIDFAAVEGKSLILRAWKDGDRIAPLGLDGTKLVSDLLTDEKVPLNRKKHHPVMAIDDEIVWVCGVIIAERFRVTEDTVDVLEMTMEFTDE